MLDPDLVTAIQLNDQRRYREAELTLVMLLQRQSDNTVAQ